jgi:hypothetical protein
VQGNTVSAAINITECATAFVSRTHIPEYLHRHSRSYLSRETSCAGKLNLHPLLWGEPFRLPRGFRPASSVTDIRIGVSNLRISPEPRNIPQTRTVLPREAYSTMRSTSLVSVAALAATLSIRAQIAEPILTKSALPFEPGAGAIKLDYAGGIGQGSGRSQAIPEGTLEIGVSSGWELLARFPLLRVNLQPHETVIGGGQLALGARYLLTGGADRSYAVSVQTIVEAPTGDTRLVGNATQVMPTVLGYWRPVSQLIVYSDLTFDRSLGGGGPSVAFLEYKTAVTWRASRHFVPAVELVGSTNTIAGRTQLVALPEVIVRAGPHLEWKAGLQVGIDSVAPELGLRAQLAWFWGRRE